MVEPYAFIRVNREIATVQTSLESIAPVIKRGVIGYHLSLDDGQDNGTVEYLKFFASKIQVINYFVTHIKFILLIILHTRI